MIHAEQERIKPSDMSKDPKKYFLYKNKKELVDHFHKIHGIKERVPVEMQGLTLADLDPLKYRLQIDSAAKASYDRIMKDNMEVKDVYDTVQKMFGMYQDIRFKNHKATCDLYGNRVIFLSKLEQMNSEFDSTIGACCANLMYQQWAIDHGRKERIDKFHRLGQPEMANIEQREVNFRDCMIFIDHFMDLNDSYEAYKAVDPKYMGRVLKPRVTKIAEYAKLFLSQLKVPLGQMYSEKKRAKVELKQGKDHYYGRQIAGKEPPPAVYQVPEDLLDGANLETDICTVGGMEFVIDHVHKQAYPVQKLDV